MSPITVEIITFGLIFTILATLAEGLSTTVESFTAGFYGRGQSLVMLLLAKLLVIPVLLISLAALLPFGAEIKMAVCTCALTAGPPFILWVGSLARVQLPYATSATLLLTVLTFLLVPFTLPAALRILGTGVTVSPWAVAWPILVFMVLPLALGLVIRARYLELAHDILPYLGPISITALLVHITLFLTANWSRFTSLFLTGVLVFAIAIPVLSMLIGFFLSPPYVLSPIPLTRQDREVKVVSVVSTSLVNVGVTILCAVFALAPYALAGVAIVVFALTTLIITALVMAEVGRRFVRRAATTQPGANVRV
jgi:BASS family bile acid:Na+ symporter